MKPDPKPIKVEKVKMTSAEFRRKYRGITPKKTRSKPKRAKTSRQKLIGIADKWFSRRVRLEGTVTKGIGNCIDCGATIETKYADCGHYFSRRHYSVRWDIDNAHLQKKQCNLSMGRPEINGGYKKNLINKIGKLRFDNLEIKKSNIWKPQVFELELIIAENKKIVTHLLKIKNTEQWW